MNYWPVFWPEKATLASAFILHLSTAVLARGGEKNGYFSISNLSDDPYQGLGT
jgi:hypothetical protein